MNTQLSKTIMHRVYAIYLFRLATRPALLKVYALSAIVGVSALYCSVLQVLHNLPFTLDPIAHFTFISVAFRETEITVQFLSLAAFVALGFLVRDIFRSMPTATRQRFQLE